jgi:hypothetical protein
MIELLRVRQRRIVARADHGWRFLRTWLSYQIDTAWPPGDTERRVKGLRGGTEAVVRWRAVVAGGQIAAVEEQLHPNREELYAFDEA